MPDSRNIASPIDSPAVPGEATPGDYFALLKPRVMSLVVFTGIAGLVVAPGDIHPVIAFTAIFCIALGAGGAGALNMWYEADIDALMKRTRQRPIPAGRMEAGEALGFGAFLATTAVIMMWLTVNLASAILLAVTVLFYVVVYTIGLKRRTPQNIVIGGAAGALPPVIGWAAVTGTVGIEPLLLFALIFMWTPPHFWALSLFRRDDYARAGLPMLPVVAGEAETRRQILIYSLLLVPVALAPWGLGFAGPLYLAVAVLCSAVFTFAAVALWRRADSAAAKRMFALSIPYLFLLFASLIGERLAGWTP